VALLVLLRFVKATLKKRVPLERELSLLARAALAIGFYLELVTITLVAGLRSSRGSVTKSAGNSTRTT